MIQRPEALSKNGRTTDPMLKLFSRLIRQVDESAVQTPFVRRISENSKSQTANQELYLIRGAGNTVPAGFAGYLFLTPPERPTPANSFVLEHDLSYLRDGDVVKISPRQNTLRTLYRRNSQHNFLLVTERCNNFCLMCSQPPKDVDDSHLVHDLLQMIPMISPETEHIGITGGEPTLLGDDLARIIGCLRDCLPSTSVHVLSNGRLFKDGCYAQSIVAVQHPNLTIAIPVYSDVSMLHDYVVQAKGAFNDTIRGIINLKALGLPVEIRVVIHKQTYKRLPQLANFIRRNLIFCDHVALMGLELTGFAKTNLDDLWIDPKDYQPELKQAVEMLAVARMPVSIYNHPLCVLDAEIAPFSRKSISDWKNEYLPECERCVLKAECGGFFNTSTLRRSAYIKPLEG